MAGRKRERDERNEPATGSGAAEKHARAALQAKPNESAKRLEAVARLESVAESVAGPLGLEVVEVEWKGSGRNQLLRIYIDKPTGVTHADCELVSRQVSEILDSDDPISGSYELEVSSPGVERKLKKPADWQRFIGKKAKVVLKDPAPELKHFDGTICSVEAADGEQSITVEIPGGRKVTFALSQVDRANLKFEW